MTEFLPGIAVAAALPDADSMLAQLEREVHASPELVRENGATVVTPRRTGWYGDADACYTYSGITRYPRPWTPALATIRNHLADTLAVALNSCLVGVYEDGAANVDWHADDEPELRDRIVSVSLGAPRTFLLRPTGGGPEHRLLLQHGTVLVMTVASQQVWQHAVRPEARTGRRINLTYRVIASS